MARFVVACLALGAQRAEALIRFDVPAAPGALAAAQLHARDAISKNTRGEDIHVTLLPGTHRLSEPLRFGPEDSGEPGRFRVVWSATYPQMTSMDGGAVIDGPWAKEDTATHSGVTVWSAALPAALLKDAHTVRQLYVGGVRYARTRTPSAAIGVPSAAEITVEGFKLHSEAPLKWKPGVEIVSDHTWVQHRCPITGVKKLTIPPPPPPPPPIHATCEWSPKTPGHSPGSSLNKTSAGSYSQCQALCCEALPLCQGIIFGPPFCYLLDRKVLFLHLK